MRNLGVFFALVALLCKLLGVVLSESWPMNGCTRDYANPPCLQMALMRHSPHKYSFWSLLFSSSSTRVSLLLRKSANSKHHQVPTIPLCQQRPPGPLRHHDNLCNDCLSPPLMKDHLVILFVAHQGIHVPIEHFKEIHISNIAPNMD